MGHRSGCKFNITTKEPGVVRFYNYYFFLLKLFSNNIISQIQEDLNPSKCQINNNYFFSKFQKHNPKVAKVIGIINNRLNHRTIFWSSK